VIAEDTYGECLLLNVDKNLPGRLEDYVYEREDALYFHSAIIIEK